MAYPGSFLRLVMAGPLYGDERWSASLSLVNWSGSTTTAPTAVPAAVATAVENYLDVSWITPNAQLDTVKLNKIGVDGLYVSDSAVEKVYTGTLPNGAGTLHAAPQLALAVSLATNVTRGLACRGRFYIPGFNAAPTTGTGLLSTSLVGSIVTASTTFINALNSALDPYRVSVVSNVRDGAFREVEKVKIGRVIDTIRSRRAQLDEDPQVGSAVAGYGASEFSGGGGTF